MRRFAQSAPLSALVLVALTSACYRDTLFVSGAPPGEVVSEWRHHAIIGLIPISDDLDLRAMCPAGVSRIETSVGALHALVSIVTLLMYTPVSVEVWCRAPEVATGAAPAGGEAGPVAAPADAGPRANSATVPDAWGLDALGDADAGPNVDAGPSVEVDAVPGAAQRP